MSLRAPSCYVAEQIDVAQYVELQGIDHLL
jgi:hypothetical protein